MIRSVIGWHQVSNDIWDVVDWRTVLEGDARADALQIAGGTFEVERVELNEDPSDLDLRRAQIPDYAQATGYRVVLSTTLLRRKS